LRAIGQCDFLPKNQDVPPIRHPSDDTDDGGDA
jgi:hypothetical protein